jgi:hypothetical protein
MRNEPREPREDKADRTLAATIDYEPDVDLDDRPIDPEA